MTRVTGLRQNNLRNRSSKHLRWLTGPGTKNILRSYSNEALQEAAKNNSPGAAAEIKRRADKKAKREGKAS